MRHGKTWNQRICRAVLIGASWLSASLVPLGASGFNDAPGVTVRPLEVALVHRPPVNYPQEAIANGVVGTLVVKAKLGPDGAVIDAAVESGPEPLRQAALASVLYWHFDRSAANTTQRVTIDFTLPDGNARPSQASATPPSGLSASGEPKTVASIGFAGLSDEAEARLKAELPIHEGDAMGPAEMGKLVSAVHAFDPHLIVWVADSQSGLNLVVRPQSKVPVRARGPVKQLRLLHQVAPVYPREARKARIEGTVRLSARIGKDGHIAALRVISGPPELANAAIDAARQWVYEPAVLNGQPADVMTTFEITFRLPR